MNTFFTSDTHFSHENIIRYCARPFASVEEMNREMTARWNAVVGPRDTVYHLGDFSLGKDSPTKFLRKLNGGKKILVRGNHDKNAARMLAYGFDEVHEKTEWNGWLLQHHPIATNKRLLCGHIHEKWTRIGDVVNVGVDVWDFTPRTIEELVVAPQSAAEYTCRHCGESLKRLQENPKHYDGACMP